MLHWWCVYVVLGVFHWFIDICLIYLIHDIRDASRKGIQDSSSVIYALGLKLVRNYCFANNMADICLFIILLPDTDMMHTFQWPFILPFYLCVVRTNTHMSCRSIWNGAQWACLIDYYKYIVHKFFFSIFINVDWIT